MVNSSVIIAAVTIIVVVIILILILYACRYSNSYGRDVSVAYLTHAPGKTRHQSILEEIVTLINEGKHTWSAKINQVHMKMGTLIPSDEQLSLVPIVQLVSVGIPESFDARVQWPGCIGPIRSQGQCGGCYAFAAAEVLSDRFCIANSQLRPPQFQLSSQAIISCSPSPNRGCVGGYVPSTWTYLESVGIPTESCYPYTSEGGTASRCNAGSCSDGTPYKVYKARQNSTRQLQGVSTIQTEIMTNGPVHATMNVYQDFFVYRSGVYKQSYGSDTGLHSIKIIGWGTDPSAGPYWICANSWGTSWGGLGGYFWIGVGQCNIEKEVYAGLPAV